MITISSDVMRGYNDTIILHLLRAGDSYGYEIARDIKEKSKGNYTIKETTLYSAFSRLEKNGLIVSYAGDETHGKRRTYYRITDHGQRYYKDRCHEWLLTKEVVDNFTEEF